MEKRTLGKSGIKVSPMGIGGWAIGGQFFMDGKVDGYGQTDDAVSIQAIQRALDLGINLIDTADAYGIGHSESLIGMAIKGRRDQIIIATKFGFLGNAETRTLQGVCLDADYVERACDASLKRLQTDRIDLYQLHVGNLMLSQIEPIIDALDKLVRKGKIRSFGWSTDITAAVSLIKGNPNCCAVQHEYNVITAAEKMLRLCEENNLASINRSPLAMGFLSGKFSRNQQISKNDVRGAGHSWTQAIFENGKPTRKAADKLDAVKEILMSDGRSPVQGAIAWLWAKSPITLPIPGFKTLCQVEENAKAMEFGPLSQKQMSEIERLLSELD